MEKDIEQILEKHNQEIRRYIDIIRMKMDITFVKSGLGKMDKEEFEALENRVAILEARTGKTEV